MTQFSNSFEGGTNGFTITTANSGGASGDAWTSVVLGATALASYSNTHVASGSLSAKIDTGGSSTSCFLEKAFATSPTTVAIRFYFYIAALPASVIAIADLMNGGIFCARLYLTSAGKLEVFDTSGGTLVLSAVNSLSLNTWYRIELQVTTSTTVGQAHLQYFLGNSVSAVESLNSTAAFNLFSSCHSVRFGSGENSNYVAWIDDTALNDTGVAIGPSVTNISLSRIFIWNVKSPLSLSRIFIWNVKSTLSLTRVFIWNVKAVLSLNRIFKWNVRIAVTPFTRIFKWNVIAGVLISRIFIWNTRQTITPVRIFKWNVRILVTPFTRNFIWNTRLQVNLARSFIWNIIFKLITARIFVWNVRSILSTSRTFLWNDVGRIIIIRSLVWDVYAPWVANVKDCGPWTSINGNTVAWTPEQVNSTSWR